MFQFWSEAGLTVLAGLVMGFVIAKLTLPFFNQLSGQDLVLHTNAHLVTYMTTLFFVTAFIAGIYPALVLSGFQPIQALKGMTTKQGTTKGTLLTWMVGAQFVLSIILIICTGVMQHQMRYLQNKNLGFKKSHVLTFAYDVSGQPLAEVWASGSQASDRLKGLLRGHSSILGQSLSSHALGTVGWLRSGRDEFICPQNRSISAFPTDGRIEPGQLKPAVAGVPVFAVAMDDPGIQECSDLVVSAPSGYELRTEPEPDTPRM